MKSQGIKRNGFFTPAALNFVIFLPFSIFHWTIMWVCKALGYLGWWMCECINYLWAPGLTFTTQSLSVLSTLQTRPGPAVICHVMVFVCVFIRLMLPAPSLCMLSSKRRERFHFIREENIFNLLILFADIMRISEECSVQKLFLRDTIKSSPGKGTGIYTQNYSTRLEYVWKYSGEQQTKPD